MTKKNPVSGGNRCQYEEQQKYKNKKISGGKKPQKAHQNTPKPQKARLCFPPLDRGKLFKARNYCWQFTFVNFRSSSGAPRSPTVPRWGDVADRVGEVDDDELRILRLAADQRVERAGARRGPLGAAGPLAVVPHPWGGGGAMEGGGTRVSFSGPSVALQLPFSGTSVALQWPFNGPSTALQGRGMYPAPPPVATLTPHTRQEIQFLGDRLHLVQLVDGNLYVRFRHDHPPGLAPGVAVPRRRVQRLVLRGAVSGSQSIPTPPPGSLAQGHIGPNSWREGQL